MNIVSSSLWVRYGQIKTDMPLIVRGSSDLLLFTISCLYIMFNRLKLNKIEVANASASHS